MATNKAKRSIHLAQLQPKRRSPNPQPAEFMPVKPRIYHFIAELNDGFEKTIHDLKELQNTNFFHSDRLAAMRELICRLRAQANREFLRVLSERETANIIHFGGLPSPQGDITRKTAG